MKKILIFVCALIAVSAHAQTRPTRNDLIQGIGGWLYDPATKRIAGYTGLDGREYAADPALAGTGTVNAGTAGQVAYYASSTAAVSGESLSALIDSAIDNTQGDILYRGASAWSVLAPGTSGQFLKTNGAAANPAWADSAGSGTVTSIATTGPITGGTITATGTIACATCTTNATSLTSNAVVLGGGSQATKTAAGFTTDGTSAINLGVAGASVGSVVFANATSGSITLNPATGALGSSTITLPAVTDTAVTLAATQTLTNKSIAGSEINSSTVANTYGGTGQNSSAATGVAQVISGTWSFSTALTSGTTATTQAAGDNSTKVATTAYVDRAVSYTIRTVSGTTDTILSSDCANGVRYTSSSAIAVTLPQATGSFAACNVDIISGGAGTITVTPTTSTINGGTTISVAASLNANITGSSGNYLATGTYQVSGSAGVTSVAVTVPTGFAVSGSPITSSGTIAISKSGDVVGGTKFTYSATGCTPSASAGGATAGTITLAAGPCTSIVVTMNGATGLTAPTGWACRVNDRTAMNAGTWIPQWGESAASTTTATIPIPSAAGATDVISFSCTGY